MVESYVLGLASEQERIEFEQLCLQYPELVAARNEFEENLEKQAFGMAVPPPAKVKENLLTIIREGESSVKAAKVIPMDIRRTQNSSWLRYVAAASVILLLASAWFTYDLYSKNTKLQNSISLFQSQFDSLNSANAKLAEEKRMMSDPNVAVVSMKGTQQKPSSANVYWDTTSSNVYLVVKNMPKLPSDKQYQLWAFIEGKPKNLGLFDWDNKNVILKMNNTQKAEAFAITIENRGNGDTPAGPVETIGKTL
jgi:anti-sigma-K factor RskA